jgi:signal transduction histidine kinase/BarA-like signal transduction histidine kinase
VTIIEEMEILMNLEFKEKTKILLVDDYPENIQTLSQLITDEDLEIHSFLRADDALASLTTHDYGLAIIDMQMPDMSGLELSRLIRNVKPYAHLPMIFLTDQQNNDQTILEGHVIGAVDFLFKPMNPLIVRSKVRMFVELQRQKNTMQLQLEELERLRIAAEAASVAKSQFLANMSHEIRTPLAAVMGFSDLIARGEVPEEEIDDCASSIRRNGNLLLRLIDDILDLSKIEANGVEMEMQHYSLGELLEDIESTLTFKAREKGIHLLFNQPNFQNQGHIFDPLRMKQILLNIIGNAIKFTHKGEVIVDVSITSQSLKDDKLTVVVKNEGEAITDEQESRLFQPFGQAEASVKRKYGGSGLGLVISRQLARAMGGDVILLHTQGRGTQFQITAVLERSQKSEMDPLILRKSIFEDDQITANFQGKRILAVDDAKDNLVLLEMFLRGTDATLTFANNGLEALELCRRHKYDIVLMDIQMPKMDGIEATEEIRNLGVKIPMIALTAYTTRAEYDKCRKAGCNDALTKPISKNNLIKALQHYLESP